MITDQLSPSGQAFLLACQKMLEWEHTEVIITEDVTDEDLAQIIQTLQSEWNVTIHNGALHFSKK